MTRSSQLTGSSIISMEFVRTPPLVGGMSKAGGYLSSTGGQSLYVLQSSSSGISGITFNLKQLAEINPNYDNSESPTNFTTFTFTLYTAPTKHVTMHMQSRLATHRVVAVQFLCERPPSSLGYFHCIQNTTTTKTAWMRRRITVTPVTTTPTRTAVSV